MDKMNGVQLIGSIIGIIIIAGGSLIGISLFLFKSYFKRNNTITDSNYKDAIVHDVEITALTNTVNSFESALSKFTSSLSIEMGKISSEQAKTSEALSRIDSSLTRLHKRVDATVTQDALNSVGHNINATIQDLKKETKEDLAYLRSSVERLGKGQTELSSSLSYYKGKFDSIPN